MLKQYRYYTYKFDSKRLKKFKYDINIEIDEAIKNEELIAQFENQIIDTILDITGRTDDKKKAEDLEVKVEKLKKEPKSKKNADLIEKYQRKIYELMLIPEYVTIQMNNKSEYKRMYEKGVKINGKIYKRFNSSASQARVNTVLFIEENTLKDVIIKTDNGRNLEKTIAPAKLNAYRGLYCSARRKVRTPRFCVVKDYESETEMIVNWVKENPDKNEDDELIENHPVTRKLNRFDGQGLITPQFAEIWAKKDLKLDYVPSEFCIRGSFLKGMLCVFDIHEFCKVENNGNYMIETIYKDEDGKPKMVDLRDIDVIITESQLKLWSSWSSVEEYIECCEKNKLSWGVTLFTPKQDKNYMYQNYQFLQTLDLDDEDIKQLASKFVNWIQSVSYGDINYTLLFLLGFNATEERYINFINSGNIHWMRALILKPELIEYKYFRMKIYNMLKKRIKDGSIGQIIADGNFQVLISDPYAMMQAVCGHKDVTGLLPKGKHYSNYWNERGVDLVIGSRSPLTYRSEHVKMHLYKDKDTTEKWYKHIKTGIIINVHGHEVDNFAGADHDYDIIATTSEPTIIKGVYDNENPVIYEAPKPVPIIPKDEDLYKADTFSFNSIIGSLTNKSTTGYALLSKFEEGSDEYNLVLKRIKTITKAQSAQIDKTKIGQEVKGIVGKWVNYQKKKDNESPEEIYDRELNNRVLMDKHPYFFKNLYSRTGKEYKEYIKKQELYCIQSLGITLDELSNKEVLTEEESKFKNTYEYFLPVIDSDCVMNKLCKHIESVDFGIRDLLKNNSDEDFHELLMDNVNIEFDDTYNKLKSALVDYNSEVKGIMNRANSSEEDVNTNKEINVKQKNLADRLFIICNNAKELTNYMTYIFFKDNKKYNLDLYWNVVGKYIIEKLRDEVKVINVPVVDENGNINYLNEKYSVKEVVLNDNE